MSADLEAGLGMRFQDTTYWPWPMAVAAAGDPDLARREGAIVAAGHVATEVFGPMRLADELRMRFPGLEAQFVPISSPL